MELLRWTRLHDQVNNYSRAGKTCETELAIPCYLKQMGYKHQVKAYSK
jgi:hypothetical protein